MDPDWVDVFPIKKWGYSIAKKGGLKKGHLEDMALFCGYSMLDLKDMNIPGIYLMAI